MNATPVQSCPSAPLFESLQLANAWRATVLLRYTDPGNLLPKPCPETTSANWQSLLANPASPFQLDSKSESIRDGHSSRVLRRELNLNSSKLEVFCKLSRRRNLLRKTVGLLRRTRPSRNWQIAWDLLTARIPTALPLAVLEKRILGLRIAAGIITQSLLPGKSLTLFVCDDAPNLHHSQRCQLTQNLAQLISRLHQQNFFHRDLKGENIFVHLAQTACPRFYLLDLDGCHRTNISPLKIAKSLARLARASLDWPAQRNRRHSPALPQILPQRLAG